MEAAKRIVIDALEQFVEETRTVVGEIAATTVEALANRLEAGHAPRRTDLSALEPLVRRRLGRSPAMLHGAGFVAAPGLLATPVAAGVVAGAPRPGPGDGDDRRPRA